MTATDKLDIDAEIPAVIRLLIVDDHVMFAESLSRLLDIDPTIEVVGIALDGMTALRLARSCFPDIVLVDFALPDMNGAELTSALRAELPDVRIISLAASGSGGARRAMIRAGSSGWVSKTRAVRDLVSAVHDVHGGKRVTESHIDGQPELDELELHYQPVLDLVSGSVQGFEALVRWQDPARGLIYPDEFLPAMEENGRIDSLSCWVIERAMLDLAAWKDRSIAVEPWVSVNISASSLKSADVVDTVVGCLERYNLHPSKLIVELTETVLLDEDAFAKASLERLRAYGVRIAIDDFGTAFSSLAYLRRFAFDLVKIDASFTAELPESARAMALVEAIQHLAQSVGLTGIAEGIERTEQAEALVAAGWRLGQGYLFSHAVDATTCEAMLVSSS